MLSPLIFVSKHHAYLPCKQERQRGYDDSYTLHMHRGRTSSCLVIQLLRFLVSVAIRISRAVTIPTVLTTMIASMVTIILMVVTIVTTRSVEIMAAVTIRTCAGIIAVVTATMVPAITIAAITTVVTIRPHTTIIAVVAAGMVPVATVAAVIAPGANAVTRAIMHLISRAVMILITKVTISWIVTLISHFHYLAQSAMHSVEVNFAILDIVAVSDILVA